MSDFKIIGNPNPVVGVEEFYTVSDTILSVLPYQNTATVGTASFEHPVKWEVYVLENRRWRKTKENDKTGKKISYTFFQKSLTRNGIRILVKRGEETARLDIKTHTAQNPKVEDIDLLDKSGKKVTKPLSYGQTLKARVHCLDMEKRTVYVTLWEEDLSGKKGHENANPRNIIETRSGTVKNGKADIDFVLKPSIGNIASMGNKTHTYYATTGLKKDKISSNNVDVTETDIPVTPYKGKTTPKEQAKNNVPVQQPKTETAKPKTSQTSKTAQGKINSVSITDTAGHAIKGVFKEKQIKVWINSTGLISKEIRLKLYDEDKISDDLLFDEKFTIKSNLYAVVVPLNQIPRSKGGGYIGEGSEFELYAEVEVLQDHTTKKSKVVDVDNQVFKQDAVEIFNKVLKFFQWSEDDKKEKEKGTCPNCEKPIRVDSSQDDLKEIFPNATFSMRKAVADTYNTYMKELGMDTCWNKAHFFAQARVETGLNLKLKNGESFNWYYQSLIDTFGKFQTEEGRKKAKEWGRKIADRKDPRAVDVTLENERNIANWAYMPDYKTGKDLGNKGGNDGWDFRGRGLLQLTGRAGYEYANTYTLKSGSDIVKHPELVGTDVRTAVLSSMAFFKWKGLNTIANGTTDVIRKICPKVGNDVKIKDKNGNNSSNYEEKQKVFDNVTSKIFKIKDCTWGKNINKDKNKLKTYDNAYVADSKVAYIDVIVPNDRRNEGLLVLFDDKEILFKCYVLAMGTTNNAIMIPEGHGSTPKGLWSSWYEKVHIGESSYGNHGLIKVTGISGDALEATKKGRSGIAIHSGHTHRQGNTINDNSYLEFTYGCMRVYNADMKVLVEQYNKLKNSGKKINLYLEEVTNIKDVYKEYDFEIDSKDVKRNYSKNAKQ